MAVLVTDCIAAAVCVALFHGAGWGMVVLLTTDCVQLAVDCVVFILQHATVVLETQHVVAVQVVEDERLMLLQQQQRNTSTTGVLALFAIDESREEASLLGHRDSEGTNNNIDQIRADWNVG
jgi:hypothetical protein